MAGNRLHWGYLTVLGGTGLYWAYWTGLGGTRLFWAVLDCTGWYQTVQVGFMSFLMVHEAYMPVYRCPDFHCAGAGSPEVVQEALADLKTRALAVLTGIL